MPTPASPSGELEPIETAPVDELRALQLKRLRWSLRHESAETPDATLESRCSRDADKLECLIQAREYQSQGNHLVQP